jgi:hypothetical protein
MKTTSHLGGRKAHTAKKRRVRYETSTKVLKLRGVVVRMVPTLCHARQLSTSTTVPPPRPAMARPHTDVVTATWSRPPGHGRHVRTSWAPSTTAKYPTSVRSTANRWNSPSGRHPTAASRATQYRSRSGPSATSTARP